MILKQPRLRQCILQARLLSATSNVRNIQGYDFYTRQLTTEKMRMQYEMGGKIGIETLLLNERLLLADFVTHEILAAAASERLRRDADLMMDWVTTVELVCLHHAIYFHRFNDMDIMGQVSVFLINLNIK